MSAATSATRRRSRACGPRSAARKRPVYYLEIPPGLFATVVAGLAGADALPASARVVVEKPFGHDLASARELAA